MINLKDKKSICWNITSRCNENCKFCYRIMCNTENTLEDNQLIMNQLLKLGIDKISWTGGECLLYPHLITLMKEAKRNNIKNNIITNGRELTPELIDKIEEYTEYITFSLDAIDDNINNNLGRGIEHAQHILELLDYLKNKHIKVKLNSIVTRENIDEVKKLKDIVNKYPIDRWKLFKFMPLRGKAIENREEFAITDEQYENLIKELKNENLNCKIVECQEEDIQNHYLLINAVGDYIVTINSKDMFLCNFKNVDLEKIKEFL